MKACAHCRKKIPHGGRYLNRAISYSVSDGIEIGSAVMEADIKNEVARLVRSIDKNKSDQTLVDEVYLSFNFELCRACREIFVGQVAAFGKSS